MLVRSRRKQQRTLHVALGMPGFDEKHEDRYALGLLSIILGGNMSSRLFVVILEVEVFRGLRHLL